LTNTAISVISVLFKVTSDTVVDIVVTEDKVMVDTVRDTDGRSSEAY
jgi:hypothetical protein